MLPLAPPPLLVLPNTTKAVLKSFRFSAVGRALVLKAAVPVVSTSSNPAPVELLQQGGDTKELFTWRLIHSELLTRLSREMLVAIFVIHHCIQSEPIVKGERATGGCRRLRGVVVHHHAVFIADDNSRKRRNAGYRPLYVALRVRCLRRRSSQGRERLRPARRRWREIFVFRRPGYPHENPPCFCES